MTPITLDRIYDFINYNIPGFNPAVFNQSTWLASTFTFPETTIYGTYNGFAGRPIFFLYAPFHWIGLGSLAVLLLPPVAYGLAAVPLYKLANLRVKSKYAEVFALSLVLSYLYFPGTTRTIFRWSFQVKYFVPLPLFSALYFAEKRRHLWYFLSLSMLLMVKQDVALIAVFLGLWFLLKRSTRKIGLFTLFLTFIRIYIAGKFFPSFLGKVGSGAGLFKVPGDSTWEFVKFSFTHPIQLFNIILSEGNYYFIFRNLLAPFGFLPLLGLPLFLIGIPFFAEVLLPTGKPITSYAHYYHVPLIPVLVLSIIIGVAYFSNLLKSRNKKSIARKVVLTTAILLIIFNLSGNMYFNKSPIPFINQFYQNVNKNPFNRASYNEALTEVLSQIPTQASVVASNNLVYPLSERKNIYLLGSTPSPTSRQPDYIIIDRKGGKWPLSGEEYNEAIRNLTFDDKYGIFKYEESGNILLFKRGLHNETKSKNFKAADLIRPTWTELIEASRAANNKSVQIPVFDSIERRKKPVIKGSYNILPKGNFKVNFYLKFDPGSLKNTNFSENCGMVKGSGAELGYMEKDESVRRTTAEAFDGTYSWVLAEKGFSKWHGIYPLGEERGQKPVENNQTYTIFYWSKNTSSSPISIGIAGEGGKAKRAIPPNSGWTPYVGNFNSGELAQIRLQNRDNNKNLKGKLYLDKIKIFGGSPFSCKEALVKLEILDLVTGEFLSSRLLMENELLTVNNKYDKYSLKVTIRKKRLLDYRVFSSGRSRIIIDKIKVKPLE